VVVAPAPVAAAPVAAAPVAVAPAPAAVPAPAAEPSDGWPARAAALAGVEPARAPRAEGTDGRPVTVVSFVLGALGLGPVLGLDGLVAGPGANPADKEPSGAAAPVRLSVRGGVHVRAGAALVSVGAAAWEPAVRRVRGRRSVEPLGSLRRPFYRVGGDGEVWVVGPKNRHVALALEDDILYVREERVLAFDSGVSWEAGRVPGDGMRMLQFRGRGVVVLQLGAMPAAFRVATVVPARIARPSLLGWVGRIVARGGRRDGPLPIECEGEGVVLLEPGRGRKDAH
jgi:hypothetical protein